MIPAKPKPTKMIESPQRILSDRDPRTGNRTVLVAVGELISEARARELGIDLDAAVTVEPAAPAPLVDDITGPPDPDATVDFDGCPTCGAQGDAPCRTPQGKETRKPHAARAAQRKAAGEPDENRERRGPAEDRSGHGAPDETRDASQRIVDVDPAAATPPEVTDTAGQDADD